jgi:PAS domain S-box-containing protein
MGKRQFIILIHSGREPVQNDSNKMFYSEDLCQKLVTSLQSAVIVTDRNGKIHAANPLTEDVFGYTPENLVGKDLFFLFTPEDQDFLYPNLLFLAERGEVFEDEVMLLRRSKVRFFARIRVCGHRDQGRDVNFFSVTDIDKTKNMEKVFNQAGYEDLIRLANGVAHGIRNPLLGVGGFLRKLNKSCAVTVEDEQYFSLINSNLKKIESIVEKVGLFSGMPAPMLARTSFKRILEGVVAEFDAQVRATGCELTIDASDEKLMADPVLLNRAVSILVENSLEACPDNPRIQIRAGIKNKLHRIMVRDNGQGISSRDLPYIFHPFFSTKPGGAGIDLVILKRIVENHHGKVTVESQKDIGTTFYIDLPRERRKKIRTSLLADKP